jgi:hypothetical protein
MLTILESKKIHQSSRAQWNWQKRPRSESR